MKREDLSYTYSHFSYMIQYKGQNIGGGGSKQYDSMGNKRRKLPSNLKLYKEYAESTIADMLSGRIDKHMKEVIDRIDKDEVVDTLMYFNHKKKMIKVKYVETGEVEEWPVAHVLEYINADRSAEWTDYDETDWEEGWEHWVEGWGIWTRK